MTTPHAELKRLDEAATPGPWTALYYCGGSYRVVHGEHDIDINDDFRKSFREQDARFIAAARQAVPALIEENERMREALEECREHLDRFSDVVDGDYGAPEPNEAMQLVQAIDQALGGLP